MQKIESHSDLARVIENKYVLHLNSLGKDSALCLEWLCNFAKPARVVSVYFSFLAENPFDRAYLAYQKKRYPHVHFIEHYNGHEINDFVDGTYQSPVDMLKEFNKWEHHGFDMTEQAQEVAKENHCDFICIGNSKYESVARAQKFHKNGLLIGNKIYPLGLMTKQNVLSLIEQTGIKLHPSYRLSQSTIDYPSYYKMRSHFIARPEYKKRVMGLYPLLALDEYRYEVLLKGKKRD
ncbi:hypothetical protein phi1422_0037 [Bdellovibrio phage phi1422]|uniref:hypothetical protein n=1 Tax=Bdellovibrio phage phi1422 TaxID=1127515 RepID=UPI0002536D59|nr:hypothetical protein F395_gp37 [Bdellovibrio phage phi1422]AFC22557.1 hypothetical protein phi1422_0037 [Bdellovibrio phage phi1422]